MLEATAVVLPRHHNLRPVVEVVRIDGLKVSPLNLRKHPVRQKRAVMRGVKQFGIVCPVLVDGQNTIIDGHLIVEVAKELGYSEIPIIRVEHLSSDECKLLAISLNRLGELAEWNKKELGTLFKDLQVLDLDFGLDVSGFELPEIDLFIHNIDAPVGGHDKADQFDGPGPDKKSVSKQGDLWLLGDHKIYCGSCLEASSYEALMVGQKAVMVFCDPPYNVKINGHVGGLGKVQHPEFLMASGEMNDTEYDAFLEGFLDKLIANTVDGGVHYVCIDWRHVGQLLRAAEKLDFELKNICVWVKDNGGMGSFYRSRHEFVCVFKSGSGQHKNNFLLGQYGRCRTNVWEYPGVNSFTGRNGEENLLQYHPTVKPVRMVEDAIMDCSDRNDLVVDCFLGSGTTLLAAERTGRICYGLELDPIYVDVAIKRWQQMTGERAIHSVSGKSFDQLEAENCTASAPPPNHTAALGDLAEHNTVPDDVSAVPSENADAHIATTEAIPL